MNCKRIENLVNTQTLLCDKKTHRYLPINALVDLIEQIIGSKETCKYISMNPFYRHKDFMVEFDYMILYIECEDNVTSERIEEFYKENSFQNDDYAIYNNDLQKRIFLCDINKQQDFEIALKSCKEYINIIVSNITKIIMNDYHLLPEQLLFGQIEFEVYAD